jgi:hypothetical protein
VEYDASIKAGFIICALFNPLLAIFMPRICVDLDVIYTDHRPGREAAMTMTYENEFQGMMCADVSMAVWSPDFFLQVIDLIRTVWV